MVAALGDLSSTDVATGEALVPKNPVFRDLLHRDGDSSCFRDGARSSGYGDDVVSSSRAGYEDSGTSYSTPVPTATCDQATSQSHEG
jgi:hypothetical protein